MSDDFSTYRQMKERGESPAACWLASREAGLKVFAGIRMLREVFGLTLTEAKEVAIVAEGRFASLDEYQGDVLLPALEAALKEIENE